MLQEDTVKKVLHVNFMGTRSYHQSSVNEVRKCMFTSKYDKGKKSLGCVCYHRVKKTLSYI